VKQKNELQKNASRQQEGWRQAGRCLVGILRRILEAHFPLDLCDPSVCQALNTK